MREQFARALPKHLSPERFCRIAITALTRTPKLAECTQESLMKCLLDLSAFGLEPDGRRAHLIPYGKDCTLVIDWKGLAELAMRSGIIAKLHADIVCENDAFAFNLGEITRHEIDFRKPRGEMYAAYALAQTKTGEVFAAVLSKDEIDNVRKRSKSGSSGPWSTDYNEMAKKTAFRRLAKWLPLSAEFRDAQDADDETENVRHVQDVSAANVPLLTPSSPAKPVVEAESFSLTDDVPSVRDQLLSRCIAASVKVDDVLAEAERGGLFVVASIPLDEQPADSIKDVLAAFDAILGQLKGGSK